MDELFPPSSDDTSVDRFNRVYKKFLSKLVLFASETCRPADGLTTTSRGTFVVRPAIAPFAALVWIRAVAQSARFFTSSGKDVQRRR